VLFKRDKEKAQSFYLTLLSSFCAVVVVI